MQYLNIEKQQVELDRLPDEVETQVACSVAQPFATPDHGLAITGLRAVLLIAG